MDGDVPTSLLVHRSTPRSDAAELLQKLRGLTTNVAWKPDAAAQVFHALLKRFESTKTNDRSDLLVWMMKMLHCIEMNYVRPSWRCQQGKTVVDLIRDQTLTDEQLQKCLTDDREKTLDEILEEIRAEKLNHIDETILNNVKDIVSAVDEDLTSLKDQSQKTELKIMLQKLCRAVRKVRFEPRLTQMVSWCLMALSETGRLLQVGTGEGKSCIVAMFAAFRALKGHKVDIMSSSTVLAERDLKDWKKFYDALKISVSCNTNKQGDDLKKCYECRVVYGTVEQFAGDWLRHHFQRMDTLGRRTFQCAIVDEVDSVMLDKGHHTVYLGSDMPALQHLTPLLARIWATANQYTQIESKTKVGQKYPFHQLILKHMSTDRDTDEFAILQLAEDAGVLAKGSAVKLRKNPSLFAQMAASISAKQLAGFFQTAQRRFPCGQFALYCTNDGAIEEINNAPQEEEKGKEKVQLLLHGGGFCQYIYSDEQSVVRAAQAAITSALHFTPCEIKLGENNCYVPGFLRDLVNSKLTVWIENAFHAQTLTQDHQYILEEHGVTPVDFSCTGVVENFMQWCDGLHQFLQMKHQHKLSDMTAITNYMSNVGLLQMYGDQIYGLTGTLGQQAETETLQRIYDGITTCVTPTFKRRKLFEVEGVIEDDDEKWLEKICSVVIAQIKPTQYRAGRAALVICETIGRAKAVEEALRHKVNTRFYVNNNMDNKAIVDEIDSGEVIIATNLAGRGTDLRVSDGVNKAGGLFVVQTFLPKNARVEAQAFGRTARQGSPGSAQLIVCCSHLSAPLQALVLTRGLLSLLRNLVSLTPLFQDIFKIQFMAYQGGHGDSEDMSERLTHILTTKSDSGIKEVKMIRDDGVANELDSYLNGLIPLMKKKGELFNQYLEVMDDFYTSWNNKPTESHVSALNEFWGMWLLTHLNESKPTLELKTKLAAELKIARQKIERRSSPLSILHHYTVFGNELRQSGHVKDSVQMYTKAIQKDHCWAMIAYYNRAFTSLAQQSRHQDYNCLAQALEDLQNALLSVDLYREQSDITYRYAKKPHEDTPRNRRGSTTRFDKHQITRNQLFLVFKENIKEAIMKVDWARRNGGKVILKKKLVYFLLPLVHVLPLLCLLCDSLSAIRSKDLLKMHQLTNHPSFDIINELRCLNALGLTHVYTVDTKEVGWLDRLRLRFTN